jgi:hypothetical protein
MTREMETKNAIIRHTFLGFEDHDIFTFILTLDYGGSQQGAGTYCLSHNTKKDRHVIHESAGPVIAKILEVVGVDTWEELKGKHIRAKCSYDKVSAIGHIVHDRWLVFEDFFKKYKK